MANGRDPIGVRLVGRPHQSRFNALVVDAHGTLVVPAGERPQSLLVKEQAEKVLGPIGATHQKLAARTQILRLRLESSLPPEQRSGLPYWGMINMDIFRYWGCTPEKALEISRRLTTNADLYCMPDERRGFFVMMLERFLESGARIFILSNSDQQSALRLVEKIGMSRYFPPDRICTPEMFGGYGKPVNFRDFAEKWKLDPAATLVVGNSGFHDVPAIALGMHVLWLRSSDAAVSRGWLRRRFGKDTLDRLYTFRCIKRAREFVETSLA